MRRLHVNMIAIVATFLCMYNLFALKGIAIAFWTIQEKYFQLSYDTSLALATGIFIYLMTSALPRVINIFYYRKIYKKNLKSFKDDSIIRLNSIKIINYERTSKDLKEDFAQLTYGHQVKKYSPKTILDILNRINNDKEKLYHKCIQHMEMAGDFEKRKILIELLEHPLFNSQREYLTKEKYQLVDSKINIGSFIKSFYDVLIDIENKIK
jgi:hypothetical protein